MKAFVFLAASVFAVSGFAFEKLPDGKWSGNGRYSMETGDKGTYEESVEIKDNVMTGELKIQLPNGTTEKMAFETKVTFKAGGFLTTVMTDKIRGTVTNGHGYCASIWCHFSDDAKNNENTIVIAQDQLFALGSHTEQGKKLWFESMLKKTAR